MVMAAVADSPAYVEWLLLQGISASMGGFSFFRLCICFFSFVCRTAFSLFVEPNRRGYLHRLLWLRGRRRDGEKNRVWIPALLAITEAIITGMLTLQAHNDASELQAGNTCLQNVGIHARIWFIYTHVHICPIALSRGGESATDDQGGGEYYAIARI